MALKRKAITRDSPEADEVVLSDGSDEFDVTDLNGVLSQSDDSDDGAAEETGSEENETASDEIDTDITDDEDLEMNDSDKLKKSRQASTQDESDEGEKPNYRVTTDANGNLRYIYDEIDPVYDSDDSDAPVTTNTIGNIPLSFYDSYPHIGYDINGKKIARPAKGEALDALLDTIEVPKGWTGLTDPSTGKPLELSKEELEVLKKIHMNEVPEEGFDPYPDMVEYFTSKTEMMPLSAAPEPKRRFVPSKHEAKRIMKIVRAIREGRIMPYKPPTEEEEEDRPSFNYDLWVNETPRPDHVMHIPAPKLPPPVFDESYHPPPEYLPDEKEKKEWQEADEEDKTKEYLPTDHDALRKVPGYGRFLKERFERCLDLYLAPRVRRAKLDIDPESLLPKLPRPEELRPFPTACSAVLRGHEGRVRSLHISPDGSWIASGGDDGVLRVYELATGYEVWNAQLSTEDPINVIRWRPGDNACLLAVALGESIHLVLPFGDASILDPETEQATRDLVDAGWGYSAAASTSGTSAKDPVAQWMRPPTDLQDAGSLAQIRVRSTVKSLAWHRRGEYFSTVSPQGQTKAVAIHALSKHLTQLPFRRLRGLPQAALFHPSRPLFFIATQHSVRSYDLARQELHRIDQPGARWVSSIDLHPGGSNLLVGSYDKRLLWHDLELDTKPHKTLRYHSKAIRAVKFHQGGLPLFADASDDGTLQVFHGKVVNDLMENATIVPLKVLRGHVVRRELGIFDLDWHGEHPWLVSAGADGTCRVWT